MLCHKMPSYYYKVITEFQIKSGDQFASVPARHAPQEYANLNSFKIY